MALKDKEPISQALLDRDLRRSQREKNQPVPVLLGLSQIPEVSGLSQQEQLEFLQ